MICSLNFRDSSFQFVSFVYQMNWRKWEEKNNIILKMMKKHQLFSDVVATNLIGWMWAGLLLKLDEIFRRKTKTIMKCCPRYWPEVRFSKPQPFRSKKSIPSSNFRPWVPSGQNPNYNTNNNTNVSLSSILWMEIQSKHTSISWFIIRISIVQLNCLRWFLDECAFCWDRQQQQQQQQKPISYLNVSVNCVTFVTAPVPLES